MNKIFTIAFVLLIYSTVSAQSETDTTDFFTGKTLLFKFNGLANLSLTNFNGGIGIKQKFWLFDNSYSRISFDWRFSHSKSTDSYSTDYESESSSLINDYLFEFRKRGKIKPYFGIGGLFGVSELYDKADNPERKFYSLERSIIVSGRGLLGFEYCWTDNITLSAEYVGMISFTYSESSYSYFNKESNFSDYVPFGITRKYDFSVNTVSFIFSVYL